MINRLSVRLSFLAQAVGHDRIQELIALSCHIFIILFVKFKILAQDAVVKAEVKRLRGLRLGIQPQNHLRLIELQQRIRRQVQSGGAGHLSRRSLDADELIALEYGRLIAENLLGDHPAGIIASARACMILSARLEVHAFIHPAHGPVDLPCQLTVKVLREVKGSVMAAGALILRHRAVLRQRGDLRGIPAAVRAVNAHRIIGFPFSLLRGLGTEAVQNVENLPSFLQGMNHMLGIFSGTVHGTLITVIHFDTEALHSSLEFHFKMLRIALTAVVKGIRHIHIGTADVFLPGLLPFRTGHLCHVYRNFSEPVELIPGKKQLCLLPLSPQSLHNKQAGGNIPEITDMNGAGGTDSGRANILFLVRSAPDDFLRDFV